VTTNIAVSKFVSYAIMGAPTAVSKFVSYAILGPPLLPQLRFQQDWPNPLTPRYAIDLRTWTGSINLILLHQDQFFGAAGQGPVYDWPNPQRQQTRLWNFDQPLNPNFAANPFFCVSTDLPLRGYWRSPGGADSLNLSLLFSISPFFGAITDQPVNRPWRALSSIEALNLSLFSSPAFSADDGSITIIW
jgi:hypothetical protein